MNYEITSGILVCWATPKQLLKKSREILEICQRNSNIICLISQASIIIFKNTWLELVL